MTRSTAMNISELTLLLPGSYRDSKHKLSTALQRTTKEVNMKVRFKNNILSYTGKVDNLVFYWNQRLQRTYAERTYNLPQFGGVRPLWNNLYMQIMYGLKALNPDLDLQTISRAYIELHDLPCRSVARAVDAGLLPPVRGYEELDSEL